MMQHVLHKGQVVRGYLRAGAQILVQKGKLHLHYAPHSMGECLFSQTRVLLEGEVEYIEEAAWLSLTGDGAQVLIIDTHALQHRVWKLQALWARV
jgi:hypothetical protein